MPITKDDTRIPEETPPLYQAIRTALKKAITVGALGQGDVFTEIAVADVLQTSRTPVKLALHGLAEEGMVRKSTGHGYIVVGGRGKSDPLGSVRPGRRISRKELSSLIMAAPPKRSAAAWTTIYDEVEREISGRSVFGPLRLIEMELAHRYGVSRTVAHEVLMRLERLGIIEKDERSRWLIVPMTPERVRHIYEVRRHLEPPAIRKAASRIPIEMIDAMSARLLDVQQRYPEVCVSELDGLERDLHVDIIRNCGNPELIKLLRSIQALLIHNKHMLGSYLDLPQLDPFMSEHAIILAAIARDDGAEAAHAMDEHLRSSLPNVLERLDRLLAMEPTPLPPYLVRD